MTYLTLACNGLIALVFAVSGVQKLRGRSSFDRHVRMSLTMLSAVVPGRRPGRAFLRRFTAALIAGELAVPVLIFSVRLTRYGQALAVVLLLAFTTGIVASLARGVRLSCNCFGSAGAPLGVVHVIRNVLLLFAAIIGLAGGIGRPDDGPVGGAVVAIAAAILTATLVVRLDDLLTLFRLSRPSR